MMHNLQIFVLFAILTATSGFVIRADDPYYIKKCSRNNDELSQCIVNNANKAIPVLVRGDSRYRIPNMAPLKIPEVIVRNDDQLTFKLRNVRVYGLEKTVMKNAHMNFVNNILEYDLAIPKVTILGDYEMLGHILNEPVNGAGNANITILSGRYSHGIQYSRFDGRLLVSNVDYQPQRVIYNFNNLYRGNEFIGYQTNVFLNNNWKDASKAFHKGAAKAMTNFVTQIYKSLSIVMPLNKLFTD